MSAGYRVATGADYEFLASRWLATLVIDIAFRDITRDVPEEDVNLLLYNAVSSFLQDEKVTTLVQENDLGTVVAFVVVNSSGSEKEVHIAHLWTDSSRPSIETLLKMAALDRSELVAYDEQTYMGLPLETNTQLNYLPLLARCLDPAGSSRLARSMRPRVLQHVTLEQEQTV